MPRRVLLIDEERERMRLYVRALRERGFDVLEAVDVDAALAVVEGPEPIDLIILDIMMPWGDRYDEVMTNQGLTTGLVVLRDLRLARPDTPVIILTNVGERETLEACRGYNGVTVLEKIDAPPDATATAVERLLGRGTKE